MFMSECDMRLNYSELLAHSKFVYQSRPIGTSSRSDRAQNYDHAVVNHSKLEYVVGLTHTNSIESFPAGAHDDAVDSTTQALNLSAGAYGVSGIIMPGSSITQ